MKKTYSLIVLNIILFIFSGSACKENDEPKNRNSYSDTIYYDIGVIKKILSKQNGDLNGPCLSFDTLGHIKKREFFVNDIKTGLSQYFNDDGSLHRENYYENGKLLLERDFGKEGNLTFQSLITDSSKTLVWWYNSNKRSEEHYYNDREDGEWKHWFENGNLKTFGTYERNISDDTLRTKYTGVTNSYGNHTLWTYYKPVHGLWVLFCENGDTAMTENYENGELVKSTLYDSCDVIQELKGGHIPTFGLH